MINIGGIFPPLPTSFDKNDELLVGKIQSNITALKIFGLRGFLILGSNGELINLSEEEKAVSLNDSQYYLFHLYAENFNDQQV